MRLSLANQGASVKDLWSGFSQMFGQHVSSSSPGATTRITASQGAPSMVRAEREAADDCFDREHRCDRCSRWTLPIANMCSAAAAPPFLQLPPCLSLTHQLALHFIHWLVFQSPFNIPFAAAGLCFLLTSNFERLVFRRR